MLKMIDVSEHPSLSFTAWKALEQSWNKHIDYLSYWMKLMYQLSPFFRLYKSEQLELNVDE